MRYPVYKPRCCVTRLPSRPHRTQRPAAASAKRKSPLHREHRLVGRGAVGRMDDGQRLAGTNRSRPAPEPVPGRPAGRRHHPACDGRRPGRRPQARRARTSMAATKPSRRRRHRPLHRGDGQPGVAQHIARPAEQGDHSRKPLGRSAGVRVRCSASACAASRLSLRPPSCSSSAHKAIVTARSRVQPGSFFRKAIGLLHFECVAGRVAQHRRSCSVISARAGSPAPPRCSPGFAPVRAPAPTSA